MAAKVFILLGMLACLVRTQETADDSGNVKLLMKLAAECGRKEDFGICLKMRAFTFLDKLVRLKEPVSVTDYVKFIRDPNAIEDEKSVSEAELEAVLPRSLEERDSTLDEMLWDRIVSFFSKRTIQLSIPGNAFEGRGDKGGKGGKKGMGGMMMMAAMMMAMMFKMALAKILLIAGKALMLAKISLVISLIMVLKKWASSSHHSEVIYASDHGGHRRSATDDTFLQYAQELAYSAQKPQMS